MHRYHGAGVAELVHRLLAFPLFARSSNIKSKQKVRTIATWILGGPVTTVFISVSLLLYSYNSDSGLRSNSPTPVSLREKGPALACIKYQSPGIVIYNFVFINNVSGPSADLSGMSEGPVAFDSLPSWATFSAVSYASEREVTSAAVGWPCLALSYRLPSSAAGTSGWVQGYAVLPHSRWESRDGRLPVRPIVLGFALNSVLYSFACVFILYYAKLIIDKIHHATLSRRLYLGLCPNCKYPFYKGARKCPECSLDFTVLCADKCSVQKPHPRIRTMIRRASRDFPLVVLEHAAEGCVADDSGDVRRVRSGTDLWRGWVGARPSRIACQQLVSQPLVRALFVIVADELRDEVAEVALAAGDEVVQALSSHRPHPTLRKRVELRRPHRQPLDHAAAHPQSLVESGSELPVAVADQDGRRAKSLSLRVCDEQDRLLARPRVGRLECRRAHDHPPSPNVQEEQDGASPPTRQRQHGPREEVAGPERLRVDIEELGPSRLGSNRRGLQAMLLKDVLHSRPRDISDPELGKLAENPGIAPSRVLRSQTHHQRSKNLGLRRSAGFPHLPCSLPLSQLPHPALEGGERDDRQQLPDGGPEGRSQRDQLPPFMVRQANASRETFAQDAILGTQELHLPCELVVSRRQEHEQQRFDKAQHVWYAARRRARMEFLYRYCTASSGVPIDREPSARSAEAA